MLLRHIGERLLGLAKEPAEQAPETTRLERAIPGLGRPVGAARTTRLTPMVPAAPATFSTTTGWPSGARIRSAMIRARISAGPPGP